MMRHSSRLWLFMLAAILLDSVLVECQKLQRISNETLSLHNIRRRSIHQKDAVKFMARLSVEAVTVATIGSIPLVGTISAFMVGTLIDVMWPTNAYDSLRDRFIEDIRKEMNHQSIERMKMKLGGYRRHIRALFSLIQMPTYLLDKWQQSVKINGLSVATQRAELENINQIVSKPVFQEFKNELRIITNDIQSDRSQFYIPNDPASSLAYYAEFASLQTVLMTTKLLLETGGNTRIITFYKRKIKEYAETHYRFVNWAAHKSASLVESKTRNWRDYARAVESILEKFPMKEWKDLSNFQDGDSIFIRNDDAASFKSVAMHYNEHFSMLTSAKSPDRSSKYYGWLSCWGAGSTCHTRFCPGEDNPFESGKQYKYHVKCRGEVFWIHGDGRGPRQYIRACDQVAIMYKSGYWLSIPRDFWSLGSTTTRTCPGDNFFNSNFNGQCHWEVFTLGVEGRSCGEKVEDRDTVTLRQGYKHIYNKSGDFVGAGPFMHQWRIFKHGSFLRYVQKP